MEARATLNGTPRWFQNLQERYESKVAHAFLLHLNVGDLVAGSSTLRQYLAAAFASRDIVVFYDMAGGIEFAHPSQKAAFVKALDLAPKAEAPAASNAMAALLGQSAAPEPKNADDIQLPSAPALVLPLLAALLRNETAPKLVDSKFDSAGNEVKVGIPYSSAVVIFHGQAIAPAADMAMLSPADRAALILLSSWGTDPAMSAAGNPVIITTPNLGDLNPMITAASSKWEAVEIPLPGYDERLAYIDAYLAQANGDTPRLDVTPREFAASTPVLGYYHLEDILLRAIHTGELTRSLIRERAQEIIKTEFGETLEFVEPAYGWEGIGGLEHIKRFFERNVIQPMQRGDYSRVPMGILMTGPAGTGKSAIAVAVAREAGVQAVRLQIGGKIASKWQGEGERNLDRALRAIKAIAPTIVFIDEIDQVVKRGGAGGGNSQENRIFQMLLEFMSDTAHRGRITFLAATNRPDLIDDALRREGRFDKKIPFLVPNDQERAAIWRVMARRYGLEIDEAPPAAVARTAGWTGAEIEAAAVKAYEIASDDGLAAAEAIVEATRRLRPSTTGKQFMTDLALAEVNDIDLLPPEYHDRWQNREAIAASIEQAQAAEATRIQAGPRRL